MRVCRGGRDRGVISIFVAISATMMLLMLGITVDAGGRLRAIEEADALAQEAARVGGQQIDEATLLSGGGYRINTAAAYAAATDYLRSDSRYKDLRLVAESDPNNPPQALATSITVVINMQYRTATLGLFGFSNLSVQGHGTAKLATDPTRPGGP